MRFQLLILFCVSLTLGSCKSSTAEKGVSSGSGNHTVSESIVAYLPFCEGNVPFVVYYDRDPMVRSSQLGSEGGRGDFKCHGSFGLRRGQRLVLSYSSKKDSVLRLNGLDYDLSKGRVFFCVAADGDPSVRQIDVPLPPIAVAYSTEGGDDYVRSVSRSQPIQNLIALTERNRSATQKAN